LILEYIQLSIDYTISYPWFCPFTFFSATNHFVRFMYSYNIHNRLKDRGEEGRLTCYNILQLKKTKTMEPRKPVQNLTETINSLQGRKAHFTSSWVKSVCDIIRNLRSEGPSIELKSANPKTSDSFRNKDDDLGSAISKIKGESFLFHVCRCIPVCRCVCLHMHVKISPSLKITVYANAYQFSCPVNRWTGCLNSQHKSTEYSEKAGLKWFSGLERLVIFNWNYLLLCRLKVWFCNAKWPRKSIAFFQIINFE
jgi:hypothetical protein